MRFLFLFMDGIGFAPNDPDINPFAKAAMPNLMALLADQRMVETTPPLEAARASLLALDASLGVAGLPQSATGQATLITGKNVSAAVGEHYGPKPNPAVAAEINAGTIFHTLSERGYSAALLNAYPQPYFDGVNSGKRLYSAIPLGVTSAGIALRTASDLYQRDAISADFTGQGWRDHFKDENIPLYTPHQAGQFLAELTQRVDFGFFEYWPSDYAGHRQDHVQAVELLESFDGVLGGLLEDWDDENGLILITSDHGNMEDLSTRRHTANPVPALVIGSPSLRNQFTQNLKSLVDITPAILQFYPEK